MQANNCGVAAAQAIFKGALPKEPRVGTIEVDLYIESALSCGLDLPTGCPLGGYDDNRPFVAAGSSDPHADTSRSRVHAMLDFTTGTATFTVSPSCRFAGGDKVCTAPRKFGQGNDFSVSYRGGTVVIDAHVAQTNYQLLGNFGDVVNHWEVTPDASTGHFAFSGYGSNFPDLAIIHRGAVVYADQANHLSALFGNPDFDPLFTFTPGVSFRRSYDYNPFAIGAWMPFQNNGLGAPTGGCYLGPTSTPICLPG
jgi:hypothetical protein